jgi:hypothetical protein
MNPNNKFLLVCKQVYNIGVNLEKMQELAKRFNNKNWWLINSLTVIIMILSRLR